MGRKTTLAPSPPCHRNQQTPKRTSHFLTLPGEIRNCIYLHLLHLHRQPSLSLLTDISSPSVVRPGSPPQPPLSRTSRQLRHEVLSIFYSERTFQIDRELGVQNLIPTWAKIMRSSLWYLRSIKFELFSEYTTPSKDFESGLCDVVSVHAWLEVTENPNSVTNKDPAGPSIAYSIDGTTTCTCKFARCARDVERGVLGSPDDALLIRFLRAWDLPGPPVRGDRYLVCAGCGGGNVQVSLRDIRRRPSLVEEA